MSGRSCRGGKLFYCSQNTPANMESDYWSCWLHYSGVTGSKTLSLLSSELSAAWPSMRFKTRCATAEGPAVSTASGGMRWQAEDHWAASEFSADPLLQEDTDGTTGPPSVQLYWRQCKGQILKSFVYKACVMDGAGLYSAVGLFTQRRALRVQQ